jgi:ubiquinone/menaquinone biosynthesis C-methylase UbiE
MSTQALKQMPKQTPLRDLANGRLYAKRTARGVWSKKANSGNWEKLIANPKSYVNADGGYQEFLIRVEEYLMSDNDIPSGAGLDIGCGAGHSLRPILAKSASTKSTSSASTNYASDISPIYGIDPAEGMIKLAKARLPSVTFIQAEASQLLELFEAKTFSIITSRGILASHVRAHHWLEITSQVFSLLKNGGVFAFDFLNTKWFEDNPKARQGRRHKFKYTHAEIEALMHKAAEQVSVNVSLQFLYEGRASIALVKVHQLPS